KLQSVGVPGFGDGDDAAFDGQLLKDRVKGGVADATDVGDLKAHAAEGVGHDGAVAAQLDLGGDQFQVGAKAGGLADALGQLGDGRNAFVVVGAVASL